MSILVALETSSLIANSLASKAVVLPAGALEDVIWWPSLQKCTAEIAFMFLGGYSTCISDNNKSGGGRRDLKTKTVKRLQVDITIIET